MNEWQPIETVPRDERVLLGHWWPEEDQWLWVASGMIEEDGAYWCDFDDDYFRPENFHAPTHWSVPIPPPPTSTKESKP